MHYKKGNNIAGWIIFGIACTAFLLTTEAGGSFWDCGEFVSSCFKVQVPHPPGAPLFILLGRLFILAFGDNPMTAAKAVNCMSALASGFTILFLFWTITHFARKILHPDAATGLYTKQQVIVMIVAGATGALAFAFTDSFWFSAVEGEVYAMSSFFTAIVFWCALKWEEQADAPGADKWLVMICFLIGLSIGVHLLCLLNIPAIVMVWYFRKRHTIHYASVRKYFIRLVLAGGVGGIILALLSAQAEANAVEGLPLDGTMPGLVFVGCLLAIGLLFLVERIGRKNKALYGGVYIFIILGCALEQLIQTGIIQYSVKVAGLFDVFFVNSLHLPFFSGFTVFFVLMGIGIWWGLRYAARRKKPLLTLSLWCLVFIMMGYSTYLTTMMRSNANTALDMFNVDNPITLEGYLGREQYGDFPVIYGQKFNARPVGFRETTVKYSKGADRYVEDGRNGQYVFAPEEKMVFPRMWDMSNEQSHADYYANYLGVGKKKDGTYDIEQGPNGYPARPDFADNLSFFFNYQNYYMYFRYFLWNFSGRQNDLQGLMISDPRDGNWITGISFIDNALYGNQDLLPSALRNNKARNTLFALPLLFGLIGLFYQYRKNKGDTIAMLLLFFCTGLAIIIYINQSGMQPRERDYAYVGSFYAFAVWIGLAVLYFAELARDWSLEAAKKNLAGGAMALGGLTLLMLAAGFGTGAVIAGAGLFVCYALLSLGLPWILKQVNQPSLMLGILTVAALSVPVLMAAQEWDDHDRNQKQLARDTAKDILESCAPNAILFTMADNDTYPVWYAQEVEGIRPDVRVVITTLISADWCINQLRYRINQSDPVDMVWSADQVQGDKRNVAFYKPTPQFPQDNYYDLYDLLKNYMGDDKNLDEHGYCTLPVHRISVPVDKELVRKNGTVDAGDSVLNELRFELPGNTLYKNDLAILNVIAANKWKRPIYFTAPYSNIGMNQYLRKEGLAYRLVPEADQLINTNRSYDVMMKKFGFGNAEKPGVYFDETNRQQLNMLRSAAASVAMDLCNQGRKAEAVRLLNRIDGMMLQQNFPYGYPSRANDHDGQSLYFLQACYRAGETKLAAKVKASIKTDLEQQLRYYNSLTGRAAAYMQYEQQSAEAMLKQMETN